MKIITKTILTIVAILFANACATTPTVKSVAGAYEHNPTNQKLILEKNGEFGQTHKGKSFSKGHWEIVNGELRKTYTEPKDHVGITNVFRINKDGSLTHISYLVEGKRHEMLIDKQRSWRKLD